MHFRAVDVIKKNLLHLLQPQGLHPPHAAANPISITVITSDEAYGTKTRPACELTPKKTKWNATIGLMQGQQPCLNCISPETQWTSETINATAGIERRMENC